MALHHPSGRELTPRQAACYLAAILLVNELKARSGPMRGHHPMTTDEIALRVAAEKLRRELMARAGETGYELPVGRPLIELGLEAELDLET